MAAKTDARSGVKFGWADGEDGWGSDMNNNLVNLGRFGFHLSVKNKTTATPPVSPAAGDAYIVATGATGAWAGKENQLAVWDDSAWQFKAPRVGYTVLDESTNRINAYTASGWVVVHDTMTKAEAIAGSAAIPRTITAEVLGHAVAQRSGYKVYGVQIDEANTDPAAVTYTHDAVGMATGKAWDTMPIFKSIRPCVLKNGVVQYYLNPNNLAQKDDGTPADITSGNDGDVMVEIPKIGYKITSVNDIVTVLVTDKPDDPDFKYYAHTRDTEGDRENLYVGAYLGWEDGDGKLRSLSDKMPTVSKNIGEFRTLAQANGAGYDQMAFYPLTLLQCLYLIKYKNRDSQTSLGRGWVDSPTSPDYANTGGTNAKGIDYGEQTGKLQMCFLNIEDFWGNLTFFIDGFWYDASRNIWTAFKGFTSDGSGGEYTNQGIGATENISGYVSKIQGTTETGFVCKECSGSFATYYADNAYLNASRLPNFGGTRGAGSTAGAFRISVHRSSSTADLNIGARLMFL